jgi:predicted naringenin-chalcone synthase
MPDYSLPAAQWQFYSPTENLEPFPNLDKRMQWYKANAAPLSLRAIHQCLREHENRTITHLITVSCTGMSAPGLDLELMELLGLPPHTIHSSVNFMGCYAAIHALKMADAFCKSDAGANVLIVCTELCTLHFQKAHTTDNITSSMLFSDGAAAILVTGDNKSNGLSIDSFYSTVVTRGKQDMIWDISSSGFLMTLSGYIADLVEADFNGLVKSACNTAGLAPRDISHWCIHPGGKRILESVHKSLDFKNGELQSCYDVLREYGNMSSPTVLFVLDQMWKRKQMKSGEKVFCAAFGPGISMETFILSA